MDKQNANDEISLKELIQKVKEWFDFSMENNCVGWGCGSDSWINLFIY